MISELLFTTSELIYQAEIQFTGMVELGVSMEDLNTGRISVPPCGARFDQFFEGVLVGPKLHGKIAGTDYLYVRPDKSFRRHLHGRITTEEGVNITPSSEGVSLQFKGEIETQIRSAVSLFTLTDTYQWLNYLQLWTVEVLNPTKGEAMIRAYTA